MRKCSDVFCFFDLYTVSSAIKLVPADAGIGVDVTEIGPPAMSQEEAHEVLRCLPATIDAFSAPAFHARATAHRLRAMLSM